MKKCIEIILMLTILLVVSCETHQKFNKIQWNHVDGSCNHRDEMMKDLMDNVLYKGMTYKEVQNL